MMGADLTYECLNACTIRVHLRAYRDCTGSNSISNTVSFISQTPGCGQPTALTAGWSPQVTTEVTPLCPGAATSCTVPGSAINGVQEFYWFRDFDICSVPNCQYTISWSGCCRNPAITSLSNAGSQSLGISQATLNTSITPCNSSPQFINPPVPYICAGQPFTFNQGAFDPENDSLVYSLGPCYQTGTTLVTYAAGYSAAAPLGPSWSVAINSATGDITVTPQPGNVVVGVFCVYVQEYRNGALLNTIVRDIQMTVLNCPANNLPTVLPVTTISGGSINGGSGYTVNTCVGSNLCFQLATADPNTTQSVTSWWSQNIAGATFVQVGNPLNTDTIYGTPGNPPIGQFCWTPTNTGTFNFIITTIDDACPIVGQNQFTVSIVVGELSGSANFSPNGCGSITLCANDSIVGFPPYSFQWYGQGGLTNNPNAGDSCVTHVYPATGTYQYILEITDSLGCIGNDTGEVSVFINVFPDAGQDVAFCSGGSATIGTPALPNYTYSWSPGTGLSSTTAPQPTVTLTNNGATPTVTQYIVTAVDNNTGCSSKDTTEVTVYPLMSLSTSSVIPQCFGGTDGSATVNVTGGATPYSYQWGPTAGNQVTATATSLSAGIYSVTVTDSVGCTANTTVQVGQPPQNTVTTTSQATSCFGGSDGQVSATASGGTAPYTYVWNPGNVVGQTINNFPAGTYTVIATDDNGCSATGTATVTEPSPVTVTTVSTPTTCAVPIPNGTAGATPAGGTPGYTYLWSDPQGQTTAYATGLAAGNYSVTVTDANGCTAVGTVVVGTIPPPDVTAGADQAFCEGEGGGMISAVASNGTPGYWYTWTCASGNCGLSNPNSPNPNANPTTSQWYYVQVTDTNGCTSNLDSLFVTILPKPIVNAGPDIYLCGDSAPCQIINPIITNATGPYTYQWFPATGLNNPNILNPCARPDTTTAYTLVVTAGNGCTSDFTTTDTLSTVVVHVNPIPVANAGPDREICEGDSIELEGFGLGAGPLYTYEWSPSSGLSSITDPNPMASPAITTVYTLVTFSNNCPSYGDEVVVNVHTLPTVDAGPDREICLGDEVMLDGQAGGDSTATYTYFWWPDTDISDQNVEDPFVSPISTTTYYLQSTTNYGCDSPVDSVLVTLLPTPIAEAGDNVTVCLGNEEQLNGSYSFTTTDPANPNDIFFTWTPGTNLSSTTILDPISTPTASGYYYLTVLTGICSTQDSVFVTVIPELGLEVEADTNVICDGGSVNLTSTALISGLTYEWTPSSSVSDPSAGNTTASPTESTTYTLVGVVGGCYDTASVTIDVLPTPDMGYLSSVTHGCAPHPMSFIQSTADAVSYIWDFGDGSPVSNMPEPSHIYEEAGTYTVTLTGVAEGGCEASINTMNIVVANPPVADFHTNPGFPVQLSLPITNVDFLNDSKDGNSFRWDFGDGFISADISPSHTYTGPGTYMVTLTVTNAEGCISEVTHGPFVILAPDLFIPNVFSPNDDDVNDVFAVTYTGSQPYLIQIFDRWGTQVWSTNNRTKHWNGKDSKGLDANDGIYYYVLKIGEKSYNGNVTLVR